MITFYPGPSKIDERLPKWLEEGLESRILSANHRSEAFMLQYQEIQDLFREVFELPSDFEVYFLSSATECWEVISQSFAGKSFHHYFNGSFGEKWYETNRMLGVKCQKTIFSINEHPPAGEVSQDVICITHNETSNGSKVPDAFIIKMREDNPEKIIAVDATSSMAGVMLPWISADIWYASVQKCFGLPAGMGIFFCHKRALKHLSKDAHYNSIENLHRHYLNWQTTHTPNVANIYFLWCLLQDHKGLALRSEKITNRAKYLYDFFEDQNVFSPLIEEKSLRSDTVLCIKTSEIVLADLAEFMESKEIILGKGYGAWKNETFRIANFPAIKRYEFDYLKKSCEKWLKENRQEIG